MAEKIGFRFGRDFFIHQLIDGQADILIGQMIAAGELTNEFFEHVQQSKVSRHESKVKMGNRMAQDTILQHVRKVCAPVRARSLGQRAKIR